MLGLDESISGVFLDFGDAAVVVAVDGAKALGPRVTPIGVCGPASEGGKPLAPGIKRAESERAPIGRSVRVPQVRDRRRGAIRARDVRGSDADTWVVFCAGGGRG